MCYMVKQEQQEQNVTKRLPHLDNDSPFIDTPNPFEILIIPL